MKGNVKGHSQQVDLLQLCSAGRLSPQGGPLLCIPLALLPSFAPPLVLLGCAGLHLRQGGLAVIALWRAGTGTVAIVMGVTIPISIRGRWRQWYLLQGNGRLSLDVRLAF